MTGYRCRSGTASAGAMVKESSTQGAQAKQPAQMDAWMGELKKAFQEIVEPTQQLCIDMGAPLTTVESNYVLMESTLREEVVSFERICLPCRKSCPTCNNLSLPLRHNYKHLQSGQTLWRSCWEKSMRSPKEHPLNLTHLMIKLSVQLFIYVYFTLCFFGHSQLYLTFTDLYFG